MNVCLCADLGILEISGALLCFSEMLCQSVGETKCVSASLQRVWVERSGAARGNPDVTASVPIGAVQCSSLPTASLLRRQQDQSRGSYPCV